MNKIIIITGPTASGKTGLAVNCAKYLDTEIINADSVIFYKKLNIGSAKPTEYERQNIKHHLIDILNIEDHYNAFDFMKDCDKIIKEISDKGKIPIIVGGSPLYMKCLLYGFFESEEVNEEVKLNLQKELTENGLTFMYEKLKEIDIDAYNKINQNDELRIMRALTVFYSFNKKITDFQKEHEFKEKRYDYLKLAINYERSFLYDKINKRVDEMLKLGLIDEVKELLESGYHYSKNKSMLAIGYKEVIDYLEQNTDLNDLKEKIKQNTRHFAKRQLTWYRKETDINWLSPENALNDAKRLIDDFIK